MPISLREFVTTHHGVDNTDALVKKMSTTPPNVNDKQASAFYYDGYKKLSTEDGYDLTKNKILNCILEYIILNKAPGFASLTQAHSFFGQPVLLPELVVFLKAFIFDISDLGNCSHRSGYASLKLHEMFKNTPIRVVNKSADKVDQYVVLIGNKTTGWFVYDPLTNPELIFTHEEYAKTILTLFTETASAKGLPVCVTITPSLNAKYTAIATALLGMLPADIDGLTATTLLSNPNIRFSIDKMGVPRSEQRAKLEEACEELRSKFGAQLKPEAPGMA